MVSGEGTHEAIIDEETFRTVQRLMAVRTGRTDRERSILWRDW